MILPSVSESRLIHYSEKWVQFDLYSSIKLEYMLKKS